MKLLLAIFLLAASVSIVSARKPNVVVFLSDDQGWGDFSLHGNTNLSTPNIDSLAKEGAQFERFFVCPVCSPTRAEFLTGREHRRAGVYSTSAGGERMSLDEETIADVFKAAGYATGAFGKWHNGMQYPYHPNGRGFDEFYGFCSGHWGNYFSPPLEHNGKKVQGKGFVIDDFTDKAISFIEDNKDQAFFAYLPYNTPHSPWQAQEKFYQRFADADLSKRYREPNKEDMGKTRCALAMCENIDWNVGRILKRLDQLGLADDTIVLYFNDNGPNSSRWNGDMKGRKGATDEGGVRSPLLVRWPAKIKPGTVIPQISSVTDLLPTLADCAELNYTPKNALDGLSVKPLLLGGTADWPDRTIISAWKNKVSVRTQQYRYDHQGKLFDMIKDPGQRKGIANDHPELKQRFAKIVSDWKAEVDESLSNPKSDDRAFPVGFRAFPTTQLPARDGVAHGKIKRSNKFPNCSFYTNWVDTADTITWDIEVATAGTYEAVIDYACPAADVGSTIQLRFKSGSVRTQVREAHDPPLRGMAEDREPRAESYVKDFAEMSLGTLQLEKGRGQLVLEALEKPGRTVLEFRNLWLTLKD